jgi:Uncharacterized conserved protein
MESAIYQIIHTSDGSPSLNWLASGEAMHNRQGAFSESLVIYGSAIEESIKNTGTAKVLSVGLGLGYNEILTAALSLQLKPHSVYLESFEEEMSLRNHFLCWLQGKQCELSTCYNEVVQLTADHFRLSTANIKSFLQELYEKKQFVMHERLDSNTLFSKKFHCVLYDPFSANTNPECWQEEWLEDFLYKVCDSPCVFSTYAAKGTLKRSLLKQGFEVITPEGFGGKRQRTYACK